MPKLLHDNVTAVICVNNMGDIKSQTCNNIVYIMWNFYSENQQWVAAAHIPGTTDIEADKQSRALEDATEWKLKPALFHKIVEKFGKPENISLLLELISNWIYLCLGIQKPEAMTINAFFLTWNSNYFYMLHLSVLQVEYQ